MRGAYGAVARNDTDFGYPIDEHIEALPPNVRIRIEAGSQLPDALQRIAGQLLDHLYPEHPRFASQTGAMPEVRRTDLTAVLQAVEAAKADKLQRYEPAKGETAALYRVAHNLQIAQVTEVFLLQDTWLGILDDAARSAQADTTEIRVRDLKKWILDREEGKGLPPEIVDLLVLVYAVQSDRAWMRAGKRYTDVGIGRLDGDIVLRRQPLPSEEDFDLANRRAEQLFKLSRQPVLNARAVQRLAEQLKEQGGVWLAGTEGLLTQLERHAELLGLDEEAPRMQTARAAYELLGRLRGLTDDTALVTALAQADLPREPEIYRISMAAASAVAAALEATRWETFELLAQLSGDGSEYAGEAAELLERLGRTARFNEQQKKLATELEAVSREAFALIKKATARPAAPQPPVVGPAGADGQPTDAGPTSVSGSIERVTSSGAVAVGQITAADDPGAVVAKLREQLGIPADATIEITVRAVE